MYLFHENVPKSQPLSDYIAKKSNANVTTKCRDESIPVDFGKEFIIGAKIQHPTCNSNFYHIHFRDEMNTGNMRLREAEYGILKVDEPDKLTILKATFEPHHANLRFVFINNSLELHAPVENGNGICTIF